MDGTEERNAMRKEITLNVPLDEEQERQLNAIRDYYNARGFIKDATTETIAVSLLQVAIKEESEKIRKGE